MKQREIKLLRKAHKTLCAEIGDAIVQRREMEELINDYRGAKFGNCKCCGAPTIDGRWIRSV